MQFAYDAMDRMIARIDQSNNQFGYAFDLAGRMTTRTGQGMDIFTYDAASRMLTATSGYYGNTVTKSYNPDGTLASETLSAFGKNYPVMYGYDAANRNTSITYPSGKVVTRAYDPRGLLIQIQYNGSNVISRTYDNGGRLSTSTYGHGAVETRTYRSDNLVSSIVTPGIASFSYSWDANKNKTGEVDSMANPYSWTTGTTGYDAEDRLIGWNRNNGESGAWNLSKVGDWNSVATNGVNETRSHNAVHELLSRDASNLSYDPRGNLVTKTETGTYYSSGSGITTVPPPAQSTWNYSWDADNRLVNVNDTLTESDIVYNYDALGRRVSKNNHSVNGDITIFVSSLNQEIAEYGSLGAVTAPRFEYVFGSYIDEVLMQVTSPTDTKHYYHQDAQYSTRSITTAAGVVVERYAYAPYGKVIYLNNNGTLKATQASAYGNTILYTGRRLDTETGLYYFRARYYDSTLGRFIGRDPIGYTEDSSGLYLAHMAVDLVDAFGYESMFPPTGYEPGKGPNENPAPSEGGMGGKCRFGPGVHIAGPDIPAEEIILSKEPYRTDNWPDHNSHYYNGHRKYWEQKGKRSDGPGEAHAPMWILGFRESQDWGINVTPGIGIGPVSLEFSLNPGNVASFSAAPVATRGSTLQQHCWKFTSYLFVEKVDKIDYQIIEYKKGYNGSDMMYPEGGTSRKINLTLGTGYTQDWKIYVCGEQTATCSASCPVHFGQPGSK